MLPKEVTKGILIYDIESKSDFTKPTETHKLRVFGCYSYDTNKYYCLYKEQEIKDMIARHTHLIGFNNVGGDYKKEHYPGFDNRVLAHQGFGDICRKGFGDLYRFKKKYNIDLFPIIKKRASAMQFKGKILENLLMRNSLDYITQTLELADKDTGKKKLDYTLLYPEVSEWTPENKKLIEEYTIRDLEITKKLYEWIEEYFESFRGYVNDKDVESKKYLTASTASFTYKSICHAMGWEEKYTDSEDAPTFGGGYVSFPAGEHFNGKIYCLDYNSLYPSIMHQCNIFSPADQGWNGNGKFKVKGIYDNKEQGNTAKLVKKMYEDRLEFKKTKDPRQYSLKIQLNACFSSDTEILTSTGIKNIKDCKKGEAVYSINKSTGNIEIKKITDTQKILYDGKLIHFKSKNTDLLVTPDHDMLYKHKKGIETIKANNLIKKAYGSAPMSKPFNGIKNSLIDLKPFTNKNTRWFVKLNDSYSERTNLNLKYIRHLKMHELLNKKEIGKYKGNYFFQETKRDAIYKRFYKTKDFLYLIGMFIAEGSIYKNKPKKYSNGNYKGVSHKINISQYYNVNEIVYNKIDNILSNLNFRYHKNPKGFNISSKFLYDFYKKYIGTKSDNKSIPDFLFSFDHSLLKYLHDGLYDGDGTKNQYRYSTNSIKLKNNFIRLNLLLGYRTTVSYNSNCYRIFRTGVGLSKPKFKYKLVKNKEKYVYCITVDDNHTVFAGRNNKLIWTGQCYGLLGNPVFTHMYNHTSAADVTRIGRQWVKLARNTFSEHGYKVIYTDTDSVYILDPYDDKDKMLGVKDKIIKEIKGNVPFPYENFDMGVDAEISDIWFFKGDVGDKATDSKMDAMDKINKSKKLIKKNYIYRETNGHIEVKNLGVNKKSLSAISRKLFWEILIPEINERRVVKFSETEIKNKIHEMLEADLSLASIRFNIKPLAAYDSKTSMQYRISEKHGSGIKFLIPVVKDFYDGKNKLTIGISKKYILDSDFKKLGLKLDDIELKKIWKELVYFIKNSQTSLEQFMA